MSPSIRREPLLTSAADTPVFAYQGPSALLALATLPSMFAYRGPSARTPYIQFVRYRSCSHIEAPLYCLSLLRCRPCSHIKSPLHALHAVRALPSMFAYLGSFILLVIAALPSMFAYRGPATQLPPHCVRMLRPAVYVHISSPPCMPYMQFVRYRPCSHIETPPHCLHLLRCRPGSHIEALLHCRGGECESVEISAFANFNILQQLLCNGTLFFRLLPLTNLWFLFLFSLFCWGAQDVFSTFEFKMGNKHL